MAQPPLLLKTPQLPVRIPTQPSGLSAQNLTPQNNHPPSIPALNSYIQPGTVRPMTPSNPQAFRAGAPVTPVPGFPTLQRPTLPVIQPQKNSSGSPATTLLPEQPIQLTQPRLITPTQKTTVNEAGNHFRAPGNTNLPMMPSNNPPNGIHHSDQDLPDYSLLGFIEVAGTPVNSDHQLLGYSPLDKSETGANTPKLFRLPSAINVKPASASVMSQVPVSPGLQGGVFATSFNQGGNPISPRVYQHGPSPLLQAPNPLSARRPLNALNIPKPTPAKIDLPDVNPKSEASIINLAGEMHDSFGLTDMLGVSERDCERVAKMLDITMNLSENTIGPEPFVFQPFANVFGKKKGWKIDLQKMYFDPVISEKNLLGPNSPAVQLRKNLTAKDITSQLTSLQVISFLPENEANYVAFNRDVFHCPPLLLASDKLNQTMLKSPGSAVRLGEEKYRQPSNQVSILLDTIFQCDGNVPPIPVTFLSVSTPALDDNRAANNAINSQPVQFARPEMQTYIDFSSASKTVAPVFKEGNYKIACETIRSHVVKGAKLHAAKDSSRRVILCAYGVKAFLSALRDVIDAKYGTGYTKIATAIMAKEFAQTVIELRKKGQAVSFSDVSKYVDDRQEFVCQDFWDLVNANLTSMGQDELKPVNDFNSKLGQNWVKKGDLICNAWDPDSLLGNALALDNSFDGHAGLRSLIHLIHALACRLFNSSEYKPGAQLKIKL